MTDEDGEIMIARSASATRADQAAYVHPHAIATQPGDGASE